MSFFRQYFGEEESKPKKREYRTKNNDTAFWAKFLSMLKTQPTLTNKQYAEVIGISERQVARYIQKFVESGTIATELTYQSYFMGGVRKIHTTRKIVSLYAISENQIDSKDSSSQGQNLGDSNT